MTHQNLRHGMCWKLILTIHVISSSSSSLSSPMNFIEVTKKISLLTHKKTQPSSQPHAGFFDYDAIPVHFLAHAQTLDRGVEARHSRPQSPRSFWLAAGIESSGSTREQPLQACTIDADCAKPDGQNSVISFVISKCLLPELSGRYLVYFFLLFI